MPSNPPTPERAKKDGIRGFPTAFIRDGDGKKVGETGYRDGGAEAYAGHLLTDGIVI